MVLRNDAEATDAQRELAVDLLSAIAVPVAGYSGLRAAKSRIRRRKEADEDPKTEQRRVARKVPEDLGEASEEG